MRIFIITFILLAGLYAALFAFGSVYKGDPPEILVAVAGWPLLALYMLSYIGVPGLLENGGLCGHGWCGPSVFGWIVMFIIVVAAFAAISALVAVMFSKTIRPM